MSGVSRQGDACSGHGCWPPRAPSSWSGDVFVNGLGVLRNGDSWPAHCCTIDPYPCHPGTSVGSGSVYVNGTPVQICGDPISCGSTHANCSSDVFAKGA